MDSTEAQCPVWVASRLGARVGWLVIGSRLIAGRARRVSALNKGAAMLIDCASASVVNGEPMTVRPLLLTGI